MFGGYNPALPYYESSGTCYGFHYFSDTFILDHSSPSPLWRHVITRSFPTYRAQGQLVADSATGKMFLFGGYTNTSWVPAGKHSYGDIWQLVVDVSGGLFEGVDWEDEKWCASMGPWQICYTCKTVGSHKKCGGALVDSECEVDVRMLNPDGRLLFYRFVRRTRFLLHAELSEGRVAGS